MLNELAYQYYNNEKSDSDVTVVILMGSTERFDTYNRNFVEFYKKTHSVLCVNFPGIGEIPLEESFPPAELASRTLDAIKKATVCKFSLVCFSFGCFVGMEIAALQPENLQDLVLFSPGVGSIMQIETVRCQFEMSRLLKLYKNTKNEDYFLQAYKMLFGNNLGPEDINGYLEEKKNLQSDLTFAFAFSSVQYSSIESLHKIKCRVLIVHGLLDNILPPDNVTILLNEIEDAQVVTSTSSGHNVHLEYEQILPRTIQFLQGVDVGGRGAVFSSRFWFKELQNFDKNFKAKLQTSKDIEQFKDFFKSLLTNKDNLEVIKLVSKFEAYFE